jgi:hypothetical protein
LRFACAFFCAAAAAFFDLAEGDFFPAAWKEKHAWTDTSTIRKASKKRLTCTDFNFAENRRP